MSIERSAQQGGISQGQVERATLEGQREERERLLAMAQWYRDQGQLDQAAEYEAQAGVVK